MNRRRGRPPGRPPGRPADFKVMRERLGDIGEGLSAVFQAVSQVFSDGARNPKAGTQHKTPRTDFRMTVSTVDDAIAGPRGIDHFERGDELVVTIILGGIAASDIDICATPLGLRFVAGTWLHEMSVSRAYSPKPTKSTQHDGRLTLHFTAISDPEIDTK